MICLIHKSVERPTTAMKRNKWSGLIAGLILGVATASFGQYGPGYGQPYPNGNPGYNPAYPNGSNGYDPNYPNGYGQGYPNGYNNGYGPTYPNGYNGYYPYGRPYPAQPPVVIVPPRVVIAPPPPPVVVAPPPIVVRPYPNYRYGYRYHGGRIGNGWRRW